MNNILFLSNLNICYNSNNNEINNFNFVNNIYIYILFIEYPVLYSVFGFGTVSVRFRYSF